MKFVVFLLLLVTYGVSASNKSIDVVVGVSDGYPVYYYDSEEKSFKGTMVESFKLICREANLNCMFRSLPKKRVEEELVSGSIHFGSVINSKSQIERLNDGVYFTQFNVPANLGIYSTRPKDQIPTELEAYFGESIICVLGWTLSILPGVWEAADEEKLHIFQSNSVESATKMLLLGRADFLYANKEKMDVFLTEEDNVHFKKFKSFNQTFALSKSAPLSEEIKLRVAKAITDLVSKGVLELNTGKLSK